MAGHERHAESFGQAETEVFKQRCLSAIGANDAAQSQLAMRACCGWQDHVGAVDGAKFLEDGARTVAEAGTALPLLQRLPQHVGEKAHQDVRQHAVFALMPDGADRQLAFVDAKRGFRLGELDIGPPQRLGAPVAQIGAQQVATFAVA